MTMPTYNSDMMHCCQEQCKKANQCYRYWLGQHATGLVSMYRPTTVNPDCEFFIEMKD